MDWNNFYKKHAHELDEPSDFAKFVVNSIKQGEELVDLGAGNGKDVGYFKDKGINAYGIDSAYESKDVIKMNVKDYIKNNPSPENVYTRFFWHSIDKELQSEILNWCKGNLFIEARTVLDVPKNLYGAHKRNLVIVSDLIKDVKSYGFQILFAQEGKGLSKFQGEDPFLIRLIVKKI